MSFEVSRSPVSVPLTKSWRQDAARVVEELFPATPPETWNLLLDLRGNLLEGTDWNHTLDVFLACRERLEVANYLPFYRLRRLLSESLRLEGEAGTASLKQVLVQKHRSLAEIRRAFHRELFEHDLSISEDHPVDLRVVEVG